MEILGGFRYLQDARASAGVSEKRVRLSILVIRRITNAFAAVTYYVAAANTFLMLLPSCEDVFRETQQLWVCGS